MDASEIVAATAEAWRKYASVGAIAPHLLRPHVRRAWERAHDQGASPWVARAEVLSTLETERMLDKHAHLLVAAKPYMHLLSRAAGQERHAAMLGNAAAVVLNVVGDAQSVNGPECVPGPGALLSEAMCGSNGIGSPLAEGRYVEIVSPEHFIHGFHPFTCHGIPIDTPDGGRHGVLSVSVRRPEAAERMHEILVCAAYGIATELARLQLAERARDIMATRDPEPGALELLSRELALLGAPAPLDPPRPAHAGIFHVTMELLRAANDLGRRLEERELAWRELASDDLGVAGHVELTEEVTALLGLLATESRCRRASITYHCNEEHIGGLADRRKLRRDLFRLLLRGLEIAEDGGHMAVFVGASLEDELAHVRVRVEAVPGPARCGAKISSSVVCPASRVLLA